jgi:hypothetical protein
MIHDNTDFGVVWKAVEDGSYWRIAAGTTLWVECESDGTFRRSGRKARTEANSVLIKLGLGD